MVNTNLVDSIRYYMEHGYTRQQVIDYLVSFGYPLNEVTETYDFVEQTPVPEEQPPIEQPIPSQHLEQSVPKVHSNKKLIMLIVILVIIIGGSFGALAFWQFTKPVCGNGIVENGETMETCCFDIGCIGEQSCIENICTEPVCGDCQYLEDHSCNSYECCDNDACGEAEECINKICTSIECGFCEYALDHACIEYECCSTRDCSSGMECVDNSCIIGCEECQYRDVASDQCVDYECCNSTECASNQECSSNTCVNLSCSAGEIVMSHECITARECSSDSDCDDNNTNTINLCAGVGTTEAHCLTIEQGDCDKDSDCDDDDITTEDICAGSPKECSNTLVNCNDIGTECTDEIGICNETMYIVGNTDYCCVGICTIKPDVFIDEMAVDNFILEIEVEGINTVNASSTFKLYAFENETQMKTMNGTDYYTINGQNETELYYFNITLRNATINLSATVDYDDEIDETNETNNEMSIEEDIPEE